VPAARASEARRANTSIACDNGIVARRDTETFYDAVGGHDTFVRIVDRFYAGVETEPELRALYPEQDLRAAAHRLTMFLEQYWGGPSTYSDERGHPRLGMRHAPFAVTPHARDLWLSHMRVAVDEAGMSPQQAEQLWEYLERAAHFLVNTFDESEAAGPPADPGDTRRALPTEPTASPPQGDPRS
jgi:hemoglobin